MKKVLDILFGSLQAVTITITVVAATVVGLLYVGIHSRLAGMLVEHSLTQLLAQQLGTRVTVDGDAEVSWNNQVVLNHLTIYDQHDDTLIYARRTMVAYELLPLLSHHLVLNTCQLVDFDIRANRASADSAANYQFLIDALRQDDTSDKPFVQRLDLNAILLRQGSLSYNVIDRPASSDSPVDANHIHIQRLSANVHVHDKELVIKKFHCSEHGNAYKADLIKMALNFGQLLHAPAGEHHMLLFVKGLDIEGSRLQVHADLNGDSDTFDFFLHQFNLPEGHPALPGIENLLTKASVRVSQLTNPFDSLYLSVELHELSLQSTRYGKVELTGSAEGTPLDAQLHGVLSHASGQADVTADVHRSPSGRIQVNGQCTTSDLDLARLLPRSSRLGKAQFNVDFDLLRQPSAPLRLAVSGQAGHLEWRGHSYQALGFDCQGQGRQLHGTLQLSDSLGAVQGSFDLDMTPHSQHYLIDAEVAHLNPQALRLCDISQLDSMAFSASVHADIQGPSLQEVQAQVKLRNIVLTKGAQQLSLGDFSFEGTPANGLLTSSIARIQYSQRPTDLEYFAQGRISVVNDLLAMLKVPVVMSKDILFEAHIDAQQQLKQVYLDIPTLDIFQGDSLTATFRMNDAEDGMLFPLLDFRLNNAQHSLQGTVKGIVQPQPFILSLEPTTLLYNDQGVQLAGARVMRDSEGDYVVEDVSLSGGQQRISVAGVFDGSGPKDFVLSLQNFELGQVFSNFERGYVHFSGRATGNIVLNSAPELTLSADSLLIRDFAYIDTLLGDARINLQYVLPHQDIDVTCDLESFGRYLTHIDCDVDLSQSALDLRVQPDHLPLGFINYWCGNILQQFSGTVSGPVRLFGPTSHLQLEGRPFVDGRFTHDIIGAHFHLSDTVALSHNLLSLSGAHVDDCHGHPLTLDAEVTHQDLHNFGYDVRVRMPEARQGFLVLDRPKAPGRLYWGQLYAQGTAHLVGGNGKHRIDVEVGTTDKSWLYVSPRAHDVNPDQGNTSFITFRDKQEHQRLAQQALEHSLLDGQFPLDIQPQDHTDLVVKLSANATDQCEVTVQLDPSSDDLLVCRGNGALSIGYDPQRDLTLSGEYNITQGTYTMNVKPDIINKRFQLQNTSSVSFNGVPSEADIHLDAVYPLSSVNLSDLGQQFSMINSISRTTVPIDCQMNVTGQLASPQIQFGLEVKNGNKDLDDLVHNSIGTQEMINQQVLYLLLFSKFYPLPDVQASSQIRPGAELTSLASASINSQINQLLSRLSDNVTLGTNFKSDRGDFSDVEMDLSVSTSLFDNRLLLYGNVGYRDPANRIGPLQNSNSFIGDFDIEYVFNRTFRGKVYSHYNERDYSINNALTTQGVGFIIRHDFDSFRDFLHHHHQSKPHR